MIFFSLLGCIYHGPDGGVRRLSVGFSLTLDFISIGFSTFAAPLGE